MTYFQLYSKISDDFKNAHVDDYSFQAKQLVLSFFDFSVTDFVIKSHNQIETDYSDLMKSVKMLIDGTPLQYLLGKWNFMGFDFKVGKGVLIPRPETEMLVEFAVKCLKDVQSPTVFDLCSGTGCVGISLAKLLPNSKVFLFEKYDEPIQYINQNIILNNVSNVQVVKWDITEKYPMETKIDCIVSNPPYINSKDLDDLQKQVQFEPKTALDGGEDGLDFYRTINRIWLDKLKINGFIAVEHGDGQSKEISGIFADKLKNIKIFDDLSGIDRIVSGFKK